MTGVQRYLDKNANNKVVKAYTQRLGNRYIGPRRPLNGARKPNRSIEDVQLRSSMGEEPRQHVSGLTCPPETFEANMASSNFCASFAHRRRCACQMCPSRAQEGHAQRDAGRLFALPPAASYHSTRSLISEEAPVCGASAR